MMLLIFSRHMFMHFSCIRSFFSSFSKHVLCFLLFFFSLSLSLIDCVMAPKQHKSTTTWKPLQGYKSSSSFPPSHIQFRDEKA